MIEKKIKGRLIFEVEDGTTWEAEADQVRQWLAKACSMDVALVTASIFRDELNRFIMKIRSNIPVEIDDRHAPNLTGTINAIKDLTEAYQNLSEVDFSQKSEAEELRRGIEKLLSNNGGGLVRQNALQNLLDQVDARNSFSYLEEIDVILNKITKKIVASTNNDGAIMIGSVEVKPTRNYTFIEEVVLQLHNFIKKEKLNNDGI